ncbi:MAG: hypothetical protein ING37_09355 [Rhodocyclaceae bacterium]|nr:hypothetical protein [Rhodocyclaceae bacterium]MCA3040796.1 hypothetical protein [Rhodocyclaceae bacterium]MCA3045224.1 hypothetical protein [Rhodocyclaceae bacterium]MCA3048119.1 hypothetical protein [Rhodocyclaceae bacterium]
MKTIVRALLLAAALIVGAPAFASQGKFADANALGRWITYYYTKPEPQRVAEALLSASAKGFMKEGQKAPFFIGFTAGIFSKNPTSAPSVGEKLASLSEVDQPMLVLGIWYSTYPEAKQLLQRLSKAMPKQKEMIDHLLANGRLGLLELPLEQGPWVLDALWGNFMATGDSAPVVRIISALPWINVRGDISRLSVGGSARWSLISNAIQHKPVMAVCKKELLSQPKEVVELLRDVIAEAEKDMREGKTN